MHTRSWLRRKRKEYNLTQHELAQLAGCTDHFINYIESAFWSLGNFEIWDKIYNALGIDFIEKSRDNIKIIEKIKKDIETYNYKDSVRSARNFRLFYSVDKNEQITFITYKKIDPNDYEMRQKDKNNKRYKFIDTTLYYVLEAFTRQNKCM